MTNVEVAAMAHSYVGCAQKAMQYDSDDIMAVVFAARAEQVELLATNLGVPTTAWWDAVITAKANLAERAMEKATLAFMGS